MTGSRVWELALGSGSENVPPPRPQTPRWSPPGVTGRSGSSTGITGHTGAANASPRAAGLGSAAGQTEVWAPLPPPARSAALGCSAPCSEPPSGTWTAAPASPPWLCCSHVDCGPPE